ncbi:MAG: hypothetical protein ABI836_09985 [Gemmatimonadota bacterium]
MSGLCELGPGRSSKGWPTNRGTVARGTPFPSRTILNLVLPRAFRRIIRHALAGSLALLAAACDHGAPFQNSPDRPRGPFSGQLPRRLTFSIGDDRTPTWLPDGTILYSSERIDRLDHDRCLNVISPEGGTILRQFCQTNPAENDSTNLMEAPAVSPAGRIFYHAVTSWIGQQKLGESKLMLGTAADPANATRLALIPYTAPNGKIHSSIRSPSWTGPETLIYLAEELFYEGSTFLPDTFFTGRDIVQLDVSSGSPVYTVVPGTDDASSVAVTSEPGVIYYTLGGDTRVYRRDAGGAVTVIHDFGALGIARDVAISGNHLVAVVGRSVVWQFELDHGSWVQRDEGGDLDFVDLVGGGSQLYHADSTLFRHPVFAPDGSGVVVEAQPYAPPHTAPDSEFNATNHRADLWLFLIP